MCFPCKVWSTRVRGSDGLMHTGFLSCMSQQSKCDTGDSGQVINQAPRLLVPRKNINAAFTIQIVMLAYPYHFVEISIFLQKKISTFLNF
jgi:hypothetical protein